MAVAGRVTPLLELGAGFDPELTSRENIFLNGILLGLTRQEVQAKVDGIIAFSEIEPFLDQPIRTYSGGMVARLGFSVAAHLEPEILLIDEIMAIGDLRFLYEWQDRALLLNVSKPNRIHSVGCNRIEREVSIEL